MNKHDIDLVLLDKIFQSLTMTDPDIAELFGESTTKIRYERYKMGYGRPEKIVCNVCKNPKTPNCYNKKQPGICVKCRNGMKPANGGKPFMVHKTVRTKCLKCNRPFLTRLGYKNEKINRICPICTRTNSYLGENEEQIAIQM